MFLCLFFSLINKTDDTQSKKCHLHFTFSSLLWHKNIPVNRDAYRDKYIVNRFLFISLMVR